MPALINVPIANNPTWCRKNRAAVLKIGSVSEKAYLSRFSPAKIVLERERIELPAACASFMGCKAAVSSPQSAQWLIKLHISAAHLPEDTASTKDIFLPSGGLLKGRYGTS